MDNGGADVVGICLAGDADWHADWPGNRLYFWLSGRHPGQCSDGADDGHGVVHAVQPAGEHLGVSRCVDQAV